MLCLSTIFLCSSQLWLAVIWPIFHHTHYSIRLCSQMLILTRKYVRYQWALVIFRFVPYWWSISLQVQIFQLFTCIQSCVFILCSQVNILVNQLRVYWIHGLLPIVAIVSMWKYPSKRLLISSLLKRIPTAPLSLPLQACSQLRLFNWRRCIHNTIATLLLQSTIR